MPPVTAPAQTPLHQTMRWLTTHARWPAQRLPQKAELLLLIATAAATEDGGESTGTVSKAVVRNKTFNAQMRHYTAMRRRAHINSDNSAKT